MYKQSRRNAQYHNNQLPQVIELSETNQKELHPLTLEIYHKYKYKDVHNWNNPKSTALFYLEGIIRQHLGLGVVSDETLFHKIVDKHLGGLNRKGKPRGKTTSDYGRDWKSEKDETNFNGKSSKGEEKFKKLTNLPYAGHGLDV